MTLAVSKEGVLFGIIALVVAVLLWLQVDAQSEPTTQREFDVPLEVRNVPDGMMVIEAAQSVRVVGEGPPRALDRLRDEPLLAFVDLSEAVSEVASYPVQLVAPMRLPATVKLKNAFETVRIAPVVREQRPVVIRTSGTLAGGLRYEGAEAQPSTVTVIGPAAELRRLRDVRAILDLGKLDPGVRIQAAVELLDEQGRPLALSRAEPSTVLIQPSVVPAPIVLNVPISPRYRGAPPFGYRVREVRFNRVQVAITGSSEAVAKTTTVDTEPIDLEGLTSSRTLEVRLIPPPGVSIRGSDRIRATVVIERVEAPAAPPVPDERPRESQ